MHVRAGTAPRNGHATERRTTSRVCPWQTTQAWSGAMRAIGAPVSAHPESSLPMVLPDRWPVHGRGHCCGRHRSPLFTTDGPVRAFAGEGTLREGPVRVSLPAPDARHDRNWRWLRCV